jgi:holo-[acyl-carrier protein] synthase
MIVGIGCDLVQIPRIKRIHDLFGDKFLHRIFSQEELLIMPKIQKIENYIAKRFAAKEAFSKAIGQGIGVKFKFQDIEIFKDSVSGRPFFSEKTLIAAGKGVIAHLSMSDDDPIAIAYVVLSASNHALDL